MATGTTPSAGQFSLDGARHVVLGSSPVGHAVEVTVRNSWIQIRASDVTVSGFRMKQAATDAQGGALLVSGNVNRATISNNSLSDVHGSPLYVYGGVGHRVLNNDIFRGGQEGLHTSGTTDMLIQGNAIHDNNTEAFEPGWEAGAFKAGQAVRLTMDNNTVYNNKGPGLWLDILCTDAVFSNNRIHDNAQAGIFFEVSFGAQIYGNKIWNNGWSSTAWGWGAGILSSSSGGVDIHNNVVAWNGDGISVISQNRPDEPTTNIYVHDNDIFAAPRSTDTSDAVMLGWLQDWGGTLYNAGSNNRGSSNRYWSTAAEPSPGSGYPCRFTWAGCYGTITGFNPTPGEEGGRYLTTAEKDSALSAAGIPLAP
jgi:hypothetical protein